MTPLTPREESSLILSSMMLCKTVLSLVESSRGAAAWSPGFPSPLIEPDVRISRIRLSDWVHFKACEGVTCRR
ncbi:MAG TPA: hypothetical protein VFS20_33280, partial [Longimicrobium sp.]|nr:hypothetical protein [Longimicrobium sp.]